MPLPFIPLIIGGAAAATAAAAARAFKKSGENSNDFGYFIKNSRSMYYNGMLEKSFLFIKYKKPQWVSHYDDAWGFNDEEDADDCIKQNKLRGVEIVRK